MDKVYLQVTINFLISFGTNFVTMQQPAYSIDVSQVKLNEEVAKLKQVQLLDARDIPFEELSSGVSYREFRDGKGEKRVQQGADVIVELTLRQRSLLPNNNLVGFCITALLKIRQTVLAWTIGDGTMIPGVEEAMLAQGDEKKCYSTNRSAEHSNI